MCWCICVSVYTYMWGHALQCVAAAAASRCGVKELTPSQCSCVHQLHRQKCPVCVTKCVRFVCTGDVDVLEHKHDLTASIPQATSELENDMCNHLH